MDDVFRDAIEQRFDSIAKLSPSLAKEAEREYKRKLKQLGVDSSIFWHCEIWDKYFRKYRKAKLAELKKEAGGVVDL